MLDATSRNPELAILHAEAAGVLGLGLRSKSAAIRRLAPAIERYLALGYSLRQVLAVLEQAGLPPTPLATLKSALGRHRAKRRQATALDIAVIGSRQ